VMFSYQTNPLLAQNKEKSTAQYRRKRGKLHSQGQNLILRDRYRRRPVMNQDAPLRGPPIALVFEFLLGGKNGGGEPRLEGTRGLRDVGYCRTGPSFNANRRTSSMLWPGARFRPFHGKSPTASHKVEEKGRRREGLSGLPRPNADSGKRPNLFCKILALRITRKSAAQLKKSNLKASAYTTVHLVGGHETSSSN